MIFYRCSTTPVKVRATESLGDYRRLTLVSGDSGLVEYNGRTARKKPLEADLVIRNLERLRSVMRIYFPSEQTINQSLGGKDVSRTCLPHSRMSSNLSRRYRTLEPSTSNQSGGTKPRSPKPCCAIARASGPVCSCMARPST